MNRVSTLTTSVLTGVLGMTSTLTASAQNDGVPAFEVQPGFNVSVAAQDFGQARFLETDPKRILWASQPGLGTIVTLQRQADGTPKIKGFHDWKTNRSWNAIQRRLAVVHTTTQ